MKMKHLNKSNLENLYGLSCIETFLLYALKNEKYSYQYLFFDSFLSFNEIIYAFVEKKIQFAHFREVTRIQHLCSQYGLVNLHRYDQINEVIFNDFSYVCCLVKLEYIKNKYKTELLRDDPYILLSPLDEENFYYLKDSPRDDGVLTLKELTSIFDGHIITFDIQKEITENMIDEFFQLFLIKLRNKKMAYYPNPNLTNIIEARDIIGIHRILRRRMYEFCSLYTNVDFLVPYLKELDRYYAMIEYMRLRKKIDIQKVETIFEAIFREDMLQMAKIIKELEK